MQSIMKEHIQYKKKPKSAELVAEFECVCLEPKYLKMGFQANTIITLRGTNDRYFFDSYAKPRHTHCHNCGRPFSYQWTPKNLVVCYDYAKLKTA